MPDHASKRCTRCGEVKPLDQFYKDRSHGDGHGSSCRKCRAVQNAQRYQAKRADKLEYQRRYYEANEQAVRDCQRRYHQASRDAVFGHYGTACACCGTTEMLTIDHVNGDGAQHRTELYGDSQIGGHFYLWLIKQGFPEGYQALCRACNSSKRRGERCRLDHAA